jgi:DNA-binding NarL/FixJ family response regulator
MDSYRIILADDHVLFRQGLRRILEEKADLEVVGEAGDGLDLLNLLKEVHPHMVILDISMPNLRGIEATHEIKAILPALKVLILTMHKDEEYLSQAISAGVDGYLLKEDADRELYSAIEKIRQGRMYIPPSLSDNLAEQWVKTNQGKGKISFGPDVLTVREREVLKLTAEGKSSREIADLLFISVRTVEHHRANFMEKLNLKKNVDLVKYAIRKGYI